MPAVTAKTARLTIGKHRKPEDGVCVMELASMLAGQSFSDHVRAVCPMLGAFLRGYNDALCDERRQDLYRQAAQVIGTRGDDTLAARRRKAIEALIDDTRQVLGIRARRFKLFAFPESDLHQCEAWGQYMGHWGSHSDFWHDRVMAFIDALVALGPAPQPDQEIVTSKPLEELYVPEEWLAEIEAGNDAPALALQAAAALV